MKNKAAVALGKLKRGCKERTSERKQSAVRLNLERARAKWQRMKPEDRKHAN